MRRQAIVLFDSARAGAWAGFRGVAPLERSLLFSGEGLAVDLVVLPAGGGLSMAHGQVVDATTEQPIPGARVALGTAGEPTATDAFGPFSVSALGDPSGQVLTVDADGVALTCAVPSGEEVLS